MIDLGLIGGWAAGGPAASAAATNAQTPAGAAASANADATSLAAAFGDLMQALAGADAPVSVDALLSPRAAAAEVALALSPDASAPAEGALLNLPVEPAAIPHPRLSVDRDPHVNPNNDEDNQDRSVLVASWWPPEPIPAPAPAPRILAFTGGVAEEAPAATSSVPAQPEAAPVTAPSTAPMTASRTADPHTAQPEAAQLIAQPAAAQETAPTPAPTARPVELNQPLTLMRKPAARVDTRIQDAPEAPSSVEPFQRFMVGRGEVATETVEAIEPARETAAAPAPKPNAPVMLPQAEARHEFAGSTSQGNSGEQPPLPKSFVPFRPAIRTATAPTLVLAPVPYVPVSSTSRLSLVAEASAPATTAETPDNAGVAPQIVSALRLAWSRGSGEAHIRLDPGQFGDVSVSIRVEAGQVVARIQAESPAIREWLQTNHRALQESLAQHDLKLARLDVAAPSDEARDASRRDDRDRRQNPDAPHVRRMKRPDTGPTFEFETVA